MIDELKIFKQYFNIIEYNLDIFKIGIIIAPIRTETKRGILR
jgi:hypothetical protein